MGRILKCITINEDDWNYLKGLNLNLSELIRHYLTDFVNQKKNNINGINIQLVQLELQQNIQKMSEIQAKVKNNEQILAEFKENQDKITQENLKKEAKRIEKINKCANCGNVINEKHRIELKNDCFVCIKRQLCG